MSIPFKQQIQKILNHSKLELNDFQFSDEIIFRFREYCILLQKWNDKINLTSEKNALSILETHIFDSLQYLRWLDSSHKTLDIGSGAGFPGIPLKIIYPDLDLTLLESQRKRCNFLREVIRSLKLDKSKVIEGRAESLIDQETYSEKFDRVLFRGFGPLSTCLTIGLPFLNENGRIILLKSPDEMPDSPQEASVNAQILELKEVEGYKGKRSLLMMVEKCST